MWQAGASLAQTWLPAPAPLPGLRWCELARNCNVFGIQISPLTVSQSDHQLANSRLLLKYYQNPNQVKY